MKNIFKNILIIHAGGIGDLIMFTPVLSILRDNFPGSKIDILVGHTPIAAEILQGSKIVDRILTFDFSKSGFFQKVKFICGLRKEKYDLAIVASGTNPIKGSLFAFLVGAKKRAGEYRKFKWTLYNHQVKLDGNRHKIKTNLNLLKSLDIKTGDFVPPLLVAMGGNDKKFAEEFISKNDLKNKILIGLSSNVGLKQQFKRWPKESFIELGKRILTNIPNSFILIFGSLNEKESCLEIKNRLKNNVIIIIDYPLKRVAALIDKCRVFIASDCGLGHIAATTNTDSIIIFGPTIPERTGPIGARVHLIKEKCDYPYHDVFTKNYDFNKEHQCLTKITPDRVFNKVKEILYK